MEQAYGDRLDILVAKLVGYLTHHGLVEGDQHVASEVQALRDPEAQVPRYEGPQLLELQVVQDRAYPGLDLQQVSEALSRYERRLGQISFDDGVGGYRRPWTRYFTVSGATSFCPSIRWTTLRNPSEGSLGVDGTLPVRTSPVDSFRRMASVNVPPTSIPRRY